jgi:tripartite-type tricarboxylate transporter receptor subunit TctC
MRTLSTAIRIIDEEVQMKVRYRNWLVSLSLLLGAAAGALAQDYPNRQIRLVVGYSPGGAPDFIARTLGQKLSQLLGQTVIVENKPGAASTLGTAHVAKAPADGYTLLVAETSQLVMAPYLFKNLGYHPLKDLAPVALVGAPPLVLVSSAKSSIRTLDDLVREAKANPGKINYGSVGIGSLHHIAMEVFTAGAGIDIVHIPYKGSGQSIPAILSGEISVILTGLTAALPYIRSGTMNLLGVTSGARLPSHPEIPSMSEVVKDYDYPSDIGIMAPAGLPPEVAAKLANAVRQAMDSPDTAEVFKKAILIYTFKGPDDYARHLRTTMTKYERAVKLANIQPE